MSEKRRTGHRTADAWRSHPPSIRAHAGGGASTDRLARLLYILPAAAREAGVPIRDLAVELGVPASTILADLREVSDRAFYLPPGPGTQIRIASAGGEVHVYTTGEFRRPARLNLRKAAALSFGLRMTTLSPSGPSDPGTRDALRDRLERGLAIASLAEDGAAPVEPLAPELSDDPDGVRRTLARAARDRAPCVVTYLKADSAAPDERTIHPYLLLSGEGRWYAVAHCRSANDIRFFRLDRVGAARRLPGFFEVPEDFDPEAFVEAGRIFRSENPIEVTVRYTGITARRISETSEGEWETVESFLVLHPVADVDWLVRHVLMHAGEAEVLSPPSFRATVEDRAARLRSPDPDG